jgi:hypothetical protein
MSRKQERTGSAMSLGSVIFLIFLVLKLAEIGPVADWSWLWITAPLWIPLSVVIVFMAVIAAIAVLWDRVKSKSK